MFQSTHPRGVRLNWLLLLMQTSMFQSTHPRGVRRGIRHNAVGYYKVSIHAPTRGATHDSRVSCQLCQVSIHAPTRGATATGVILFPAVSRFNPRTHAGCDSNWVLRFSSHDLFQSTHPRGVRHPCRSTRQDPEPVSIHAPTRGATAGIASPVRQ